MNDEYELSHYLLIDEIEIQNANAISSPITYGFPAINGFLGAIHALSRKIPQEAYETPFLFDGVLIASHEVDLQVFRRNPYSDYTFNQTRNPVLRTGKTPSIIEEGRVHLTVSLVVEIKAEDGIAFDSEEEEAMLLSWVKSRLMEQRIAGGSVQKIGHIELIDSSDIHTLVPKLLPAFVLMEATDQFEALYQTLQTDEKGDEEGAKKDSLDLLLETATLHFKPHSEAQESGESKDWRVENIKQGQGWLVPIPVGYQAIFRAFEPGELTHARTDQYPSQYVEPIYTLGKWVFPHRLTSQLANAFWRYQTSDDGLYLITQASNE